MRVFLPGFLFCFVFLDTFGDRNCLGFLIFNFGRGEGSLACALSLGTAMSTRKASLTEKQAKNGTSKYVLERCASINEYYDIAFKVCISVLLCLCSGGLFCLFCGATVGTGVYIYCTVTAGCTFSSSNTIIDFSHVQRSLVITSEREKRNAI